MKYTLSVLVENQPGVLSKVSGLFSRRGFNIDSLAVGVTEDPAISRITIVVNKLIAVIKVKNLTTSGSYVSCLLMLVKVTCSTKQRLEVMKIAEQMKADVVDVANNSLTLQYASTLENIETLTSLLRPYGIKELVRTGTVALERGSSTAHK